MRNILVIALMAFGFINCRIVQNNLQSNDDEDQNIGKQSNKSAPTKIVKDKNAPKVLDKNVKKGQQESSTNEQKNQKENQQLNLNDIGDYGLFDFLNPFIPKTNTQNTQNPQNEQVLPESNSGQDDDEVSDQQNNEDDDNNQQNQFQEQTDQGEEIDDNGSQQKVQSDQQQSNGPMSFDQFQNQFSREYNQQQQYFRRRIYQQNTDRIIEHNSQDSEYQLGNTQFTDISLQEFQSKYLMEDPPQLPMILAPPMAPPPDFEIVFVDWRDKMGPVVHQGKCGSCWAFSVVNTLEAIYNIQKNQKLRLSTQQLVDCCKSGCNGCRGGWPVSALQFLSKQGIATQQEYPYVSRDDECKEDYQKMNFVNSQNPYDSIQGVDGLVYGLSQTPVSVIIDASTWDPLYKNGTFNKCPKEKVKYNHAVVCVGLKNNKNWIVRNSWGINWGDRGHVYLPYGNSCGIADMGIIPKLNLDQGYGLEAPDV